MTGVRIELDHVGIAVGDLDRAAAAYRQLGFTLTPRSLHRGPVPPDGRIETWGQGNHCAMFRDGYMEVLGLTDPARHNHVAGMLARYEGIHITAYTVDDAEAAYATMHGEVDGLGPLAILERDASFGEQGDETRPARFHYFSGDSVAWPEAMFTFVQHMTPEVLWQPHLLDHPNGAVAIVEVGYCVADPAPLTRRLSAAAGVTVKENTMPGVNQIDFGRSRAYVMTPDGTAGWIEGFVPPALPCVATVSIGVSDLTATRAYLESNEVPFNEHPYPGIWVAPGRTHGPIVSFIQA